MKKVYFCEICGNTIELIEDAGVVPHCCNVQMTEMKEQTEDMGREKHVPKVEKECVKVEEKDCPLCMITIKVGDEPHPMTREHHVKWITVLTNKGDYRLKLDPIGAPEVKLFLPESEKIKAVYECCNIHGLWVNKVIDEK